MPERRTSLRDRRRKRRFAIGVVLSLFLAVGAFGLHVISYLPRLTIQHITIEGAKRLPTPTAQAYVAGILDDGKFHVISRRNIFFYPKQVIATGVATNYPRVERASVTRPDIFSNEIVVHITERAPFAKWCEDSYDTSRCLLMDERGYIFADASDVEEQPSTHYRFGGGITRANPIGQTFAPGHLSGIVALLKLLGNSGFDPLGAAIQSDNDFVVSLRQGYYIKASYGQDPAVLVHNLQLIVQSELLRYKTDQLEYVDLRFGNRVFFKLKGQSESAAQ